MNKRMSKERLAEIEGTHKRTTPAIPPVESAYEHRAELLSALKAEREVVERVEALPDMCKTFLIKKPNNEYSRGFTDGGTFVIEEIQTALKQP